MKGSGKWRILLIIMVMSLAACGSVDREEQARLKSEGMNALSEGNYDEAEKDFKAALACANGRVSEPELDLTYYLGACYCLEEDYAKAVDTYSNLLIYDKNDADAYFLRGSAYLKDEKPKKALADYQSATEIADKDYELAIAIYENLSANGEKKEGLNFINRAYEIGGDDARSLYYRGRLCQILGQKETAITTLERAVESGSDEAAVYLVKAYLKDGKKKKAKKLVARFTADDGDGDAEKSVLRGRLLLLIGDYERAKAIYDQALSAEGEQAGNSAVHRELLEGQIATQEFSGEFENALRLAREYVEQYPADQRMVRELAFLEKRGG